MSWLNREDEQYPEHDEDETDVSAAESAGQPMLSEAMIQRLQETEETEKVPFVGVFTKD